MFHDSSDETSSDDMTSDTDTSSSSTDSDEEPPKTKRQRKTDGKSTESNYSYCLKSNFKWVINDSGDLFNSHDVGEKIESPIFVVGFYDEFKWRFEFYPKGNENEHYPSLHLCLISSSQAKIDVHYDCFIVNHQFLNQTGQKSFKLRDRFAFKRFRAIDIIGKRKSFTINCDLVITIPATIPKMKVIDDLKGLFQSGNFSDVVLEIENKKFKAHKYILAARSAVFNAMFKSDMKEQKNNVVQITDISYNVMKELLRFIYTGEVENLNTIAKELLAAAEKYAFEDLKTICENSLFEDLNVNNAVDVLNFAELYNASKLRKSALEYIVHNIKNVIQTPAFKVMGNSQSPLLAQLICLMANKK